MNWFTNLLVYFIKSRKNVLYRWCCVRLAYSTVGRSYSFWFHASRWCSRTTTWGDFYTKPWAVNRTPCFGGAWWSYHIDLPSFKTSPSVGLAIRRFHETSKRCFSLILTLWSVPSGIARGLEPYVRARLRSAWCCVLCTLICTISLTSLSGLLSGRLRNRRCGGWERRSWAKLMEDGS